MTMVVFVCFVNDTKGVSQQANVCRSGETCSLRADDRQSTRARSPQTQNSKTSTQNTVPSRSSYTRQRCELQKEHKARFHTEARE